MQSNLHLNSFKAWNMLRTHNDFLLGFILINKEPSIISRKKSNINTNIVTINRKQTRGMKFSFLLLS